MIFVRDKIEQGHHVSLAFGEKLHPNALFEEGQRLVRQFLVDERRRRSKKKLSQRRNKKDSTTLGNASRQEINEITRADQQRIEDITQSVVIQRRLAVPIDQQGLKSESNGRGEHLDEDIQLIIQCHRGEQKERLGEKFNESSERVEETRLIIERRMFGAIGLHEQGERQGDGDDRQARGKNQPDQIDVMRKRVELMTFGNRSTKGFARKKDNRRVEKLKTNIGDANQFDVDMTKNETVEKEMQQTKEHFANKI